MVAIEDVLLWMISQTGKPYVLGAENLPGDDNPTAEDCSELVQNACDDAGVDPPMPDGAAYQLWHCEDHGLEIPVGEGIATRGALLFVEDLRFSAGAFDRYPHVAASLGDGTTIEAKGRAWGVGSFTAHGRFQRAALIPGVDYTPRPLYAAELAALTLEDDMPRPSDVTGKLEDPWSGGYWLLTFDGGVQAYDGAPFHGSYPGLPEADRQDDDGHRGFYVIQARRDGQHGYEIVSTDAKGGREGVYAFPVG